MKESGGNPIRILHVFSWAMSRAGAETWAMNILRNIDRARFHMDFLVESDGDYAYNDEIEALGSRVLVCAHHRKPVKYGRIFKKILREEDPYDVVHSHLHHYNGYVLRLARQEGVPVRIAHSHNDFSPYDETKGPTWKAYIRLMKRWINQNATTGLAVSPKAARALFGADWENDPRWRILYCGIDLEPFRGAADPVAARSEFGIPADALVVGHVGRFYEQKNHEFLIDIAAALGEIEPEARFLLVGDGPLRPAMEKKAARLGITDKVIFTGTRSDVPRLMLGAVDVFAFPSLYEGLGLVGIEAQAAGLPILVSDVIPEEIGAVPSLTHTLSLSQPASVWAKKILSIKKPPIPVSRQEALRTLENGRFNIDFSLKELEKVYAK